MKNFVRIDNDFFRFKDAEKQYTDFSLIETEGFTIYTYLLMNQSNKLYTQTSIRMIKGFFRKDFKGLKESLTIEKFLKVLHNNKLIEITNLEELKQEKEDKLIISKKPIRTNGIGLDDILNIKVNTRSENGFNPMSEELFVDNIKSIGHIGWSVLCLLYNLHNKGYGGQNFGFDGFANPKQEYIGKILNRHYKTIAEYIPILEKLKLIKVEEQEPIYVGIGKDGEEKYEYTTNHYIVKFKYNKEHKYYVGEPEKRNSDLA